MLVQKPTGDGNRLRSVNAYSDLNDWMPSYIRTYIYPFTVIVGVVGGSIVNLKQCKMRGMNDWKGNGLVYVSTFAYWSNSCFNVGATYMNISPNVFSTFAEYANHCTYLNTLPELSLSFHCLMTVWQYFS